MNRSLILLCIFITLLQNILVGQEIDKQDFINECLEGYAFWESKTNHSKTYSGRTVLIKPQGQSSKSFDIFLDSGRLCVQEVSDKVDQYEAEGGLIVNVFAKNYFFTVRRQKINSQFIVEGVSSIENASAIRKSMFGRWYHAERFVRAPINVFDVPLNEILHETNWVIESVQRVASSKTPDGDVEVKVARVNDDTYYDSLIFVVSPLYQYGITSFEMSHKRDVQGIVSKVNGKIEYQLSENLIPELTKVTFSEYGMEGNVRRKDLEFGSESLFTSIKSTSRSDVFTLPDYGIPDTEGLTTGGKQKIQISWLLLVSMLLIGCLLLWFCKRK